MQQPHSASANSPSPRNGHDDRHDDRHEPNICAAIIVAAGSGSRAALVDDNSQNLPKQFWNLGGKPLLLHSVDYFIAHPKIGAIILLVAPDQIDLSQQILDQHLNKANRHNIKILAGGQTRQASAHIGLMALESLANSDDISLVAIHDAARPLIPTGLLDQLIDTFTTARASSSKIAGIVPVLPLADSIKTVTDHSDAVNAIEGHGTAPHYHHITGGLDRGKMTAAQTPQLFQRHIITQLHKQFAAPDSLAPDSLGPDSLGPNSFTDDCGLAQAGGYEIVTSPGANQLMKLTDADDFAILFALVAAGAGAISAPHGQGRQMDLNPMNETRTGTGFDVHKFTDEPGPIYLAGIKIDNDRQMLAHSDGDVGLHALTDAIFGALADGDIGFHFPPSDAKWRNADSAVFLKFAVDRVIERGGRIINLDLTLICETPKIGPLRDAMRSNIAQICKLSIDRVAVKATTSEGLGFTGRGEGIAAQASASISLPSDLSADIPMPAKTGKT